MRVWVYKEEGGTVSILLQASPGKGKRPVVLQSLTLEGLKGVVGPEVDKMRGPKEPRQGSLL